METFVAKLIPMMFSVGMLGAMMVLTLGIGWASGKVIRKLLGIGGN